MVSGSNNVIVAVDNICNHLIEVVNKHGNEYWINKFQIDRVADIHLAVMVQPYLSLVMDGIKTIESRYSINMVPPYKKIKRGDIVVLKKSGGDVVALFEAGEIRCFHLTNKNDLYLIKEKFNNQLHISDDFWDEKKNAKYATLVDVNELMPLPKFKINKTSRSGWVTIGPVAQKGDQWE